VPMWYRACPGRPPRPPGSATRRPRDDDAGPCPVFGPRTPGSSPGGAGRWFARPVHWLSR